MGGKRGSAHRLIPEVRVAFVPRDRVQGGEELPVVENQVRHQGSLEKSQPTQVHGTRCDAAKGSERRSGKIPSDWRKANVAPVFRKDKKDDPGNYRLVNLTSVPGKITEQVLLEHISGNMKEEMTGSGDKGRAVDVAYLDFSKAFDIVSHSILISKLGSCGLGEWTTRWVRKWLDHWAQRLVTSGVSQGSILEQLLLNTFINVLEEET
ncbi:hypothetical protein QYF61_008768 [Mycteria americana]|uniref:Reverse transcriptase domain-containing protein n=1 Tax=Mycteria americana TaxID=33587 RepID=A0AAN7RVY4_MYCAM|nr:hypothetical protein QYF61_008768 [Mycteria americana]